MALKIRSKLELIARIHPEAWDVIWQLYGQRFAKAAALHSRGELVSLNPKPLPPEPPQFQIASAMLAHEIARGVVIAEAQSPGAGRAMLFDIVDDWCGTRPPRIPWPEKWPLPWPDPEPEPWDVAIGLAAGAMVFSAMAARIQDDELADTFNAGAERLLEFAAGGAQRLAA